MYRACVNVTWGQWEKTNNLVDVVSTTICIERQC